MAIDPRSNTTTPAPRINLEEFARQKISEVLRRKALDRTNYQEPDDTCECDDFVTNPPGAPTTPRRKFPGLPPSPPKPAILPPPLPPPPVRFDAPQLPSAIPPLIAPPPIVFARPNIDLEVDVPTDAGEEEEDTTTPQTTTESPPSDDGFDDFWEGNIPCCLTAPLEFADFVTDTDLSLGVELSTHSGEFRNGCYPMCDAGSLAQYRLGWQNPDGSDAFNTAPPAGFCDRNQIQICQCYARNAPYNPCYRGNGQVAKPGASITSTSLLKRIRLPQQFTSPEQYYASVFSST